LALLASWKSVWIGVGAGRLLEYAAPSGAGEMQERPALMLLFSPCGTAASCCVNVAERLRSRQERHEASEAALDPPQSA
jgi:hypothetical protein